MGTSLSTKSFVIEMETLSLPVICCLFLFCSLYLLLAWCKEKVTVSRSEVYLCASVTVLLFICFTAQAWSTARNLHFPELMEEFPPASFSPGFTFWARSSIGIQFSWGARISVLGPTLFSMATDLDASHFIAIYTFPIDGLAFYGCEFPMYQMRFAISVTATWYINYHI